MERTQLSAARRRKHWTQKQAAEFAGVSERAWREWEKGGVAPRLSSIEQVCQLFGCTAEDLGFDVTEIPLDTPDTTLHLLASGDLTMRLLALAFVLRRFEMVQSQVADILEDYDAMHIGETMNRREAVARLASMPFIASLRPGASKPRAEDVIMQCAASTAACWELSNSSHEEDLRRAFQTVSAFIPALKTIVEESSQYRKDAATLIGQCFLLKALLGWHLQDVRAAATYAREAIAYAKEAGDIALQVTAMKHLCWALYYDQRTIQAEQIFMQAKTLVENHQQALPPQLCSNVYSGYAVMQAQNGKKATATFDQATRYFVTIKQTPLQYIYIDNTKSVLTLHDGMIHYLTGEQTQAMSAFQRIIEPKNLTPQLVLPGRTQVETLNFMAMSVLKRKDRDMEEVLHYWKAAMRGAIALQSEQRYNEAMLTYNVMDVVWNGEGKVKELQELTTHW
jgi:DNA-binding XRE family transcriptional regulator